MDVRVYDPVGNEVDVGYWGWSMDGYVLRGLLPATYKLVVYGRSSGGASAEAWYDGKHSLEDATIVDLTSGDVGNVDVYLGVLPVIGPAPTPPPGATNVR